LRAQVTEDVGKGIGGGGRLRNTSAAERGKEEATKRHRKSKVNCY